MSVRCAAASFAGSSLSPPRPATEAALAERPSGRLIGALSLGLLLGVVGGWVAGLLRAPRPPEPPR